MRVLLAAAMLVLVAGCLESQPDEAVQQQAAPPAQPFQTQEMDGRYAALMPLGEPLQEEGGSHSFDVAGWKLVTVALDSSITVDLFLLPPGCASSDDPCALRFAPRDGAGAGSWMVDRMEAGTWTVGVEASPDHYNYVDGTYTISFEYLLA